MLPSVNRDMISDAYMDDMIGLLDLCLDGRSLPAAYACPSTRAAFAITKKQLRILGKEHLLIMLRDCERELSLEREKNGYLLLAYQAMLPRRKEVKWIGSDVHAME